MNWKLLEERYNIRFERNKTIQFDDGSEVVFPVFIKEVDSEFGMLISERDDARGQRWNEIIQMGHGVSVFPELISGDVNEASFKDALKDWEFIS